ncbi:hypothetical protein LMG3441_00642 [Achromobacter kerstersii]|uniref:Uncharacterized protein n=1 Tax=Achromobacter kerstersii TaxID=1353890 RepID=A0A6S6Z9N3_9BURK|nr:hypothetical protein LMG3441_00642 [Achromobacter kerstersii]
MKECIRPLMEARTILAWHYTRRIDRETHTLRQDGTYPATLDNILSR